jgi:hypothetical protein
MAALSLTSHLKINDPESVFRDLGSDFYPEKPRSESFPASRSHRRLCIRLAAFEALCRNPSNTSLLQGFTKSALSL